MKMSDEAVPHRALSESNAVMGAFLSFLLQEAIKNDPSIRLRALDCAAELRSMLAKNGAGEAGFSLVDTIVSLLDLRGQAH
jgi:hypothetical protein